MKRDDPLKNIRTASPCEASWDAMAGDERVRYCTLCSLNVYNFAEMTRDEVRELIQRTEGRLCARLYRRADGTLITRDCPAGLWAIGQRVSRFAAAVVAALFTVSAFASGGASCQKPRMRRHGSKVKLAVERVMTPQKAAFTGIVQVADSPLPGVTVEIRNETTGSKFTSVTDVNGAFSIASLDDGLYSVDVTLESFKPARIQHLELKANEVTNARVTMKFDDTVSVMVGAIAVPSDPVNSDGISTTYTQDFINKLPL